MSAHLLRKAVATGAAVAAVATGMVATAGTAGATTTVENTCPNLYFCLYYNSNRGGAIATFFSRDANFADDHFAGSGAGRGQVVKNNAASAQNNQTGLEAWVWFNSNFGGAHDVVLRSSWRNLTATYNENASFDWHS
ncbi:peptidase inhibitor family I36 protein [Amycolatopsis vastitatis]|uniref:Peptidase M23 n=1 Tax=Amycolatopsis vastitatis TaxID=1905142 RepID=A0A229SRN0_9PSEU|nr:peptidase inhibitor family I36 protein [Amycolatopsis vastitatis]OXM61596.1 hypothetical protein CF165_37415 [Amycolatopsis vastitatis]